MTAAPSRKPRTIWYISKYFAVPAGNSQGGRGFELMRALARQGHHCVVFTSDSNHLIDSPEFTGSHWVQEVDGVTVVWLRTLKYSGAKSIKRIMSWIHFELKLITLRKGTFRRPDAVVASSLSLFSVLTGYLFGRRYKSRFAFEVRDIWPLTLTEEGGFSHRNPLVQALSVIERFGYRTADVVIGTMPNLGEHVRKVTGRSVPTVCVPMGVAPHVLGQGTPVSDDWVATNVPSGKFVVGYAGTMGSTNALDSLFEAAVELNQDPDIHFVFVGRGDLLEHYRVKYAAQPNVTLTGAIPKESVQSALEQFDLLLLATHDSEVWRYGQSLNKMIDYMLSGKPVVAVMTGFPSMISEAGSGTFVPAGDKARLVEAIRHYASLSQSERVAMGSKGRSWVLANQTYEVLAERMFDALFAAPGRRGDN